MSTLIPTALVTRCARAGHEAETRAHPSGQPVAWGDLTSQDQADYYAIARGVLAEALASPLDGLDPLPPVMPTVRPWWRRWFDRWTR